MFLRIYVKEVACGNISMLLSFCLREEYKVALQYLRMGWIKIFIVDEDVIQLLSILVHEIIDLLNDPERNLFYWYCSLHLETIHSPISFNSNL